MNRDPYLNRRVIKFMEDKEIGAMVKISEILNSLEDEQASSRVLQWIIGRHGGISSLTSKIVGKVDSNPEVTSVADLFDAANPLTEADKVLVVAYWLQELKGVGDIDSQSVNDELKNLGHGVGNITRALSTLINRKPRLVIQTRKSGSTQQARKKYKLTVEGIRAVKLMFEQQGGSF